MRVWVTAAVLAGFALLGFQAGAAGAVDGATIVNSGSTNTPGYTIAVRSDGSATLAVRGRLGMPANPPKSFSVSSTVAQQFMDDLKAARDGHAAGQPCMKSASFGTTTRVTWHGWTSPDLQCPPGGLLAPLARDVAQIRAASGIDTSGRP